MQSPKSRAEMDALEVPLPGPQLESQLIWKLAPREAPPLNLIAELYTRLATAQDPDRRWSGLWIGEVSRVRSWAELFQLQMNLADVLRDFNFNGRAKFVDIFVVAHKINIADDGEHGTKHISLRHILERKTVKAQYRAAHRFPVDGFCVSSA
jgi:hypothetical protein